MCLATPSSFLMQRGLFEIGHTPGGVGVFGAVRGLARALLRHVVYLGEREDKPEARRHGFTAVQLALRDALSRARIVH
jgi:hypothetical protein